MAGLSYLTPKSTLAILKFMSFFFLTCMNCQEYKYMLARASHVFGACMLFCFQVAITITNIKQTHK